MNPMIDGATIGNPLVVLTYHDAIIPRATRALSHINPQTAAVRAVEGRWANNEIMWINIVRRAGQRDWATIGIHRLHHLLIGRRAMVRTRSGPDLCDGSNESLRERAATGGRISSLHAQWCRVRECFEKRAHCRQRRLLLQRKTRARAGSYTNERHSEKCSHRLVVLPNESRLSCGALKKDSFLNLRAPSASSAC
jgi:hypothetical protein